MRKKIKHDQSQMYKRVRALRETLGLTQLEFANDIGCSQQSVCMWERNERAIRRQTITQICSFFGVNEKWIRYGEGEPFEDDRALHNAPVNTKTPTLEEYEAVLRFVYSLLPDEIKSIVLDIAAREELRKSVARRLELRVAAEAEED